MGSHESADVRRSVGFPLASELGRSAAFFVARVALFVAMLRVLALVNEATHAAAPSPWWLVPIWLAGGPGAALLARRPGRLARLACVALTALALATIAHGKLAWAAWLIIGMLLELGLGCMTRDCWRPRRP